MSYEIETFENAGEKLVKIISDDENILENQRAMADVGRAIREEWGKAAETVGRGSSYFDERGREAGWMWTVEVEE